MKALSKFNTIKISILKINKQYKVPYRKMINISQKCQKLLKIKFLVEKRHYDVGSEFAYPPSKPFNKNDFMYKHNPDT